VTQPGLCGDCLYARIVTSARGATFYLCQRAADDPSYPRYPPIPVLSCRGYVSHEHRHEPHEQEQR